MESSTRSEIAAGPAQTTTATTGILPSRGVRLILWVAVFTFLGVTQAARLHYAYNSGRVLVSWPGIIVLSLIEFYLWGGFAVLISRVARKNPLEGGRTWYMLSKHLGLGLAVSYLHLLLYTAAVKVLQRFLYLQLLTSTPKFIDSYLGVLAGKLHGAVMTYFLIAFVAYAIIYLRAFRREERRLAAAETKLAQARLSALKTQLQPHFLFNTLNAISALVHSNANAADKMIARLSDLLRRTLDGNSTDQVTLRQELDFLSGYLEIEQARFSDRMKVDLDIDPATETAVIPHLLLQPVVENSIRHGISRLSEPGLITVRSIQDGTSLTIVVDDTGPGAADGFEIDGATGMGLSNTRARLVELYGEQGEIHIDNRPGKGFTVTIRLPLQVTKEGDPQTAT